MKLLCPMVKEEMHLQEKTLYDLDLDVKVTQNTIFTLIVIKLVLISVPTMYLSYSYNLIATHKILRTPYLGAPLLGG